MTDDVIRSLAIRQRLLGTTEVVPVHHTDCRNVRPPTCQAFTARNRIRRSLGRTGVRWDDAAAEIVLRRAAQRCYGLLAVSVGDGEGRLKLMSTQYGGHIVVE